MYVQSLVTSGTSLEAAAATPVAAAVDCALLVLVPDDAFVAAVRLDDADADDFSVCVAPLRQPTYSAPQAMID